MKFAKQIFVVAIAAGALLFASCKEEILHRGKTPLVGVGKEYLYKEDVQRFYNANPPAADSAEYVNAYINRWIEEALFYHSALRNVPASDEIESLVESYKRSLVLNIYQEALVEQQLQREISPGSVEAFYNDNGSLFELEESLAKGIFLKVPVNTPKLNQLRGWCKNRSEENLENLEKYGFVNNVTYEYFADSWRRLSEIADGAPVGEEELLQRLRRTTDLEFRDKQFVYFVSVDSVIGKGEAKPLEMVEGEIRELLVNNLKANFIKEKKRSIYNEALEKGNIQFYN